MVPWLQLFDAKSNVLTKSLLYSSLESWQYSVGNETLTIVDNSDQAKDAGSQVPYHFTVPLSIGNEIAGLMQVGTMFWFVPAQYRCLEKLPVGGLRHMMMVWLQSHAMKIAEAKSGEMQVKTQFLTNCFVS